MTKIIPIYQISKDTIRLVLAALGAPTHEANDHNCEDWPPGSGCDGCDGDEKREVALKRLEEECQRRP